MVTMNKVRRGRRWLAIAVMAVAMAVGAPEVLAGAQTRIGLNGGRPSEWPFLASALADAGLTQEKWLSFASRVGENWVPGTTKTLPLTYPAQLGLLSGPAALTANQSTAVGQQALHALILRELDMHPDEPISVAGLSEGTLVIERELAYLATALDAPAAHLLKFYVFGDMARGLGDMYLRGVTIPFIGYTFRPVPDSQYDTDVVIEQWDGWANPPDRPWNALAVLNAVMGAVYTVNGTNDHAHTSLDGMAEAVLVSEQTSTTLGGTTRTYMIPRDDLPLTRPLRQLGVPGAVVDEINEMLMPLIRAGYSSLTPNLGPRIEQGRLVFTPPKKVDHPADVVSSPVAKADSRSVAVSQPRSDVAKPTASHRTRPTRDRDAAEPTARVVRPHRASGAGGDDRREKSGPRTRPSRLHGSAGPGRAAEVRRPRTTRVAEKASESSDSPADGAAAGKPESAASGE